MAPQESSLFVKGQFCLVFQSIFELCLCVRTVLSLKETAANKTNSYADGDHFMEQLEESFQQFGLQRSFPDYHSSLVLVKFFGPEMGNGLAFVPVRSLKLQTPACCSHSSRRMQMEASSLG